jgi:predicted lactoylglutathione lyase
VKGWRTIKEKLLIKIKVMHPKKIWANLGVSDLERTTKFYSELGLKSNGSSKELTSFFFGEDDFIMHFFLKEILQANTRIQLTDPQIVNEIIFTISAESKEQVNNWAKEVEKAGGKIISNPEEFGKGYYGFVFADPDGHKFNVFYM